LRRLNTLAKIALSSRSRGDCGVLMIKVSVERGSVSS
jgi:hypothetical protein